MRGALAGISGVLRTLVRNDGGAGAPPIDTCLSVRSFSPPAFHDRSWSASSLPGDVSVDRVAGVRVGEIPDSSPQLAGVSICATCPVAGSS
jgi:hypothetical protein